MALQLRKKFFTWTTCFLPCIQDPPTDIYPELDESNKHMRSISLNSILNLSFLLRVGFHNSLFPSVFSVKPYTHCCLHIWYLPRPSHTSWVYPANNIWWGIQVTKLLVTFHPAFPYVLSVRPNRMTQHGILEHTQRRFFPKFQGPKCILNTGRSRQRFYNFISSTVYLVAKGYSNGSWTPTFTILLCSEYFLKCYK
jgi:hypothetical protein